MVVFDVMKEYFRMVLLGGIAVCFSLPMNGQALESGQSKITGNSDYALSDRQITSFQHSALEGSCEAAMSLYFYFEMYSYNANESRYWLQIAAENGDPVAQGNLSGILKNDYGRKNSKVMVDRDKERSGYWFERSLDHAAQGAGFPRCPQDRR
jgi:TPR repeat protein